MSKQKYFNLTVYCEGAMPGFVVDEKTLSSFEEAFICASPVFTFVDQDDKATVVLRSHKLAGYKKSEVTAESQTILNDLKKTV